MALKPAAAPMAMPDDAAPADDMGAGAPAEGGDMGNEPGDEDVLLTVCKEPDGTYSLIKGDEEDASGMDAAGSADTEGTPEAANKQTFDSLGSLLKAILDILKEDQASEGGEGSSDQQFNAGFDENAPPKPAAPMPQKF